MVSLALDGSVHLAPFASTGTFDAQTRLTTPTDMLLAAAAEQRVKTDGCHLPSTKSDDALHNK